MKKIISIFVLLTCALSVNALPGKKSMFIKLNTPDNAWVDSDISNKVLRTFSRASNFTVSMLDENSNIEPAFPQNYFDTDNLLEWGTEVGGRFIMVIDVQSERIETRKSFHLPLVFHKYQTYGVIEGEVRVFDLERKKLVHAKPFKVEEKGSRIFQATMDDDKHDPDLHISSTEKIKFFNKLEEKFVTELQKSTRGYLGMR